MGPSAIVVCEPRAQPAANETIEILLWRGNVCAAQHGLQFDGNRNKRAHAWLPWDNRNSMNRLAKAIARQLGL